MTTYATDLPAIREAATRIAPYANRTPVMTSSTLNAMAGRELFLKCENLQKVGAFKFRGACNAILKLEDAEAARGVVTHSSGNHAQAVAMAASLRGIAAHVVMPSNSNRVKREAVEGYGAKVYPCEPTEAARRARTAEVLAKTGGTFIPPFDHPDIIAGQGTTMLELHEQVPDLDGVIAPVGGGGLISGISIAARGLRPSLRIFGSEPAGADDAARSLASGRFVPQEAPDTIADGLLTSLGEQTWPIVRDHLETIVTVTDDEICAAMRLIWERVKMIIEPSSAVAVAAVLTDDFKALGEMERVGIVISGGNVDLDRLPWTHR